MINHERWEDNEWDYAPDAHEPMEMPEEWVYTEPNEGPEKRNPLAEIFTGENSLVGKVTKGIADALEGAPSLEDWLKPVEEAAKSLIRPVENRVAQVEESQLSAEEQLALLEGVRGYGAAYQRWNENLQTAPGNLRRISLAPHGVAKGARVEGGGIFIDEPGVWTVHAQVFARGTAATPSLGSDDITKLFVILREYQPVYKSSTIKEVYGKGGNGPHHIQASFTVVIENAPALLDFEVFSDRWRYFDGGTALTSFSVVKTDSRVENPGEVTVPDA